MKLNYFNYCAFCVCFIILISTLIRRIHRSRLGKYFLLMLVSVFGGSLFDMLAVSLDNYESGMIPLKIFANSAYLFFHGSSAFMYAVYTVAITDTWHILRKRRLLKRFIFVPFVLIFLMLVLNIFTKSVFYIDDNGIYNRGGYFYLLYFVSAFYIAFGTVVLIKHRSCIASDRWMALMLVIPFSLFSAVIQYMYPKYIIEMFMNSMCLMYVSMIIQRPEEFMDVETGSRNETAFSIDIKRGLANKKHFDVIVMKINNHQNMIDLLTNDEFTHILKLMVSMLTQSAQNNGIEDMEVYYLKRGMFCMVYDSKNHDKTDSYVENISVYLRKPFVLTNADINCNACFCTIRCPDDFNDFKNFNLFLNSFQDRFRESDLIYRASEIIKDKNFKLILNMEQIINRALTEKKLQVYYQPIYSVNEKRFKSAEALIRLFDDEYGFVPPDIFIPAAEKNGTIHRIGKFVLESVCSFIDTEEFKKLGVDYIDVNLSAVQFMNHGLKDEIISIMEKHHVDPKQIVFEITETAESYDCSVMDKTIRQLTNSGISFSLDDFGTGYSNISRIAGLPIKMGKLDKTFTNIDENSKLMSVTESSVHMMQSMDLDIVVEGVETEEMLKRFTSLGCDMIQGYYFSKALPEKEYVAFIREKHNIKE